jgi:hypothetical protein
MMVFITRKTQPQNKLRYCPLCRHKFKEGEQQYFKGFGKSKIRCCGTCFDEPDDFEIGGI